MDYQIFKALKEDGVIEARKVAISQQALRYINKKKNKGVGQKKNKPPDRAPQNYHDEEMDVVPWFQSINRNKRRPLSG